MTDTIGVQQLQVPHFWGIGEMLRGLVAFVTAAAVLWHAVAGCCAHHSHGQHVCVETSADVPSSQESPEGRGCCHGGSHANRPGTSNDSIDGVDAASHPLPCPSDHGRCTEGTCVVGAPGKPGPSLTDNLTSTWFVASISAVDPALDLLAVRALDLRPGHAHPPFGGVRIHLALSVLTL